MLLFTTVRATAFVEKQIAVSCKAALYPNIVKVQLAAGETLVL